MSSHIEEGASIKYALRYIWGSFGSLFEMNKCWSRRQSQEAKIARTDITVVSDWRSISVITELTWQIFDSSNSFMASRLVVELLARSRRPRNSISLRSAFLSDVGVIFALVGPNTAGYIILHKEAFEFDIAAAPDCPSTPHHDLVYRLKFVMVCCKYHAGAVTLHLQTQDYQI